MIPQDPFDRIPTPPVALPGGNSFTPGQEPAKLVPDYAIENLQPRSENEDQSGGTTAEELHFNNGTIAIDIDANGVVLTNLSTNDTISLLPSGAFEIFDSSSGNSAVINPSDMLYGNYAMNEFTVCNSGSPENRRFFCSDAYP